MRHPAKTGIAGIAVAALVTVFAAGCATTPLSTEASTSGIRAAEEVGAEQVPMASLHLQLAKEQLELAKGLSDQDQREMAESMLQRAEVDAELAVALSKGDVEKKEALAAEERVRQLRQDNP
jgi:hypothetical protein